MKENLEVVNKVIELVHQWDYEGVPNYLTGYEAYRLSGGAIGKPGDSGMYEIKHVALATVKAGN
jgi:hypothetical protein